MVLATLNTEVKVVAEPLTPEKFARYGGVISSAHQLAQVKSESANYGTAVKLFKVSPIASTYSNAPSGQRAMANWNMFRCTPPEHLIETTSTGTKTYKSKVLERHPFSTQTFVPMGRSKAEIAYMVIVAPTASDGLPDLTGLKAFTVKGDQAVTYGAGTWHAPMIALGDVVDFAVLIHENGVPDEDCQEVYLDTAVVEFSENPEQTPALSANRASGKVMRQRKGQSQEAWERELHNFHSTGPIMQSSEYFDGPLEMDVQGKLDMNRIKYAAERQYYLRNYNQAVRIIEANAAKVSGKLAADLEIIRRAARARF